MRIFFKQLPAKFFTFDQNVEINCNLEYLHDFIWFAKQERIYWLSIR